MVRQVFLTIPSDQTDKVVAHIRSLHHVHNLGVFKGDLNTLITFCGTDTKTGLILKNLHEFGVGTDFGYTTTMSTQSVSPYIVDFQRDKSKERLEAESKETRARSELAERLPVEEIYHVIAQGNKLNFDYIIMTFVAGIIASIGLLTDNLVVLVASMLLSPLMGPILGLTFGVIMEDHILIRKSLKNELVGVVVSIATGFFTALAILWIDLDSFPTEEMDHRGTTIGLITGLTIAIPSGAGVALAVTSGAINPLVGVAISASVLPPLANTGVCFIIGLAKNDGELLRIAGVSLLLWFINCLAIFLVSLLMFHVKRIRIEQRHRKTWKDRQSHTMPDLADMASLDEVNGAMLPVNQFAANPSGLKLRGSRSSVLSDEHEVLEERDIITETKPTIAE